MSRSHLLLFFYLSGIVATAIQRCFVAILRPQPVVNGSTCAVA
jgi:hypothetical protein